MNALPALFLAAMLGQTPGDKVERVEPQPAKEQPPMAVRVLNDRDEPVAGATVERYDTIPVLSVLFQPESAKPAAQVISDEKGQATFGAFHADQFAFVVRHGDYRTGIFGFSGTVPAQQTFHVLPKTPVVVRDEAGQPLKNIPVSSIAVETQDHSLYLVNLGGGTDSDGKCVRSWAGPRRANDPDPIIATHLESGRMAIAVRSRGELREPVELTLQPTRLVRVTIDLGGPSDRNPTIRWADENGRTFFSGNSSPLQGLPGQFQAQLRLPPGSYQAMVVKSIEEQAALPFAVEAGKDDLDAGVLKVEPSKLVRLAGKDAPELSLVWPDGKSRRLADMRGKIVVLYFWATWCGPCISRMPGMIELKEKMSKEPVEWIAIHDVSITDLVQLEESVADLEKQSWDGRSLSLQRVLDQPTEDLGPRGVTTERFGIRAWPTIVVIDPRGKVVGPVEKEQLEATIQELLQTP